MPFDAVVQGAGAVVGKLAGHTQLDIAAADLDAIREIRATAAARIAEKREELEQLDAELAVLDEALEENARDGG